MGQDERGVTETELQQLERAEGTPKVILKVIEEYRKQVGAIQALEQYVAMFAQGDGKVTDVSDLVADLGEILEPVRTQSFADNVIPLPMNRTFHCVHCGKPFVTAR